MIATLPKKKRQKWHIIYYILAAFVLVTLSGSLYLNHQIMGIYSGSVDMNQRWANRLSELTVLSDLAQKTNAPGNDVFDTRKVDAERSARDASLSDFNTQLRKIRADVNQNVAQRYSANFRATLRNIADSMEQMVTEANEIFRYFEVGEDTLAGQRMATMDQKFAQLTTNISKGIYAIQKIQRQNFQDQLENARELRRFEFLIGALILLMVVCIMAYGHKIAAVMRRNEAALKQAAKDAETALRLERKLGKLQRQFVYMASHEFRTPLAIIDGSAQLLESRANTGRDTPEDTIKRSTKIRDAVKRMTRLMESTLLAARMEEGKISIEIEPCDVAAIVRGVCASQQELARDHIISFELADLPKTIPADPGSLEQILTNLLSNAVKYSSGAPDINVSARGEGGNVVISVRDRGIGIDNADIPKMFERFFRAQTSCGIAGTGIGLNLAKTLVELHGGTIEVESTKGEGSTFTFRLPIGNPAEARWSERQVA